MPSLAPAAGVSQGLFTRSLEIPDAHIPPFEYVAHLKAWSTAYITRLGLSELRAFRKRTIIAYANIYIPVGSTNTTIASLFENVSLLICSSYTLVLPILAHVHACTTSD